MAHAAIDLVGDYALAHDSYDNLAHGSRELVGGVALLIAVVLAARGLRNCCEIALANRTRAVSASLRLRECIGYALCAIAASCALVPAMEWLDGRLDGDPVHNLGQAFGGSLLLGVLTTVLCASLIGAIVFGIARWLISQRDAITAILETLLRRNGGPLRHPTGELYRRVLTFRRIERGALRLTKRGPPVTISA